MDPKIQGVMAPMIQSGIKKDAALAEKEAKLSQGQTPGINTDIYKAQLVRDAGYPLANPTEQPNKYTKEGAMVYGNRDASNSQPINPITPAPEIQGLSTNAYRHRSGRAFDLLDNASNTFEVDAATNHVFKGLMQYERAAQEEFGDLTEANQMKWATSDRLEESGFRMLQESERGPEGINDRGLMGLQAVYSAHILRGSQNLESVMNQVGDTGATEEQSIAAWNSAAMQYQNARYGTATELPSSKEEQIEDKRYQGAAAILQTAMSTQHDLSISPEDVKSMTPEQLYDRGMSMIDAIKSNTVVLGAVVAAAKANPDLPVGEAINYLLSVEDQLDTTWGDFGRGAKGILGDPLTYVGGGALIAKGMAKTACQTLI